MSMSLLVMTCLSVLLMMRPQPTPAPSQEPEKLLTTNKLLLVLPRTSHPLDSILGNLSSTIRQGSSLRHEAIHEAAETSRRTSLRTPLVDVKKPPLCMELSSPRLDLSVSSAADAQEKEKRRVCCPVYRLTLPVSPRFTDRPWYEAATANQSAHRYDTEKSQSFSHLQADRVAYLLRLPGCTLI
jgi:hypothetical protein